MDSRRRIVWVAIIIKLQQDWGKKRGDRDGMLLRSEWSHYLAVNTLVSRSRITCREGCLSGRLIDIRGN